MITFIIISLIIGVIPAFIAQSKGKDFATWYVYGVFLFFFAMIHAIVLPENSKADYTRKAIQLSDKDDLYKPNTVDLNSPVEIVGHKIIGSTDDVNCVVKFRNISDKTVVATKYIIECFNSFGEPVGDDNKIVSMVQDVIVSPRDCFGYDKVVKLSNHLDTRQINVSVVKVMFDNGEVWESENPNIVTVPTINLSDEELYNLKQVIDNEAVCYPSMLEDKWMCICGRVNKDTDGCCVRCGRNLEEIKLYTKEYVEDKVKFIKI
ncbi:MAG: hypothetical protein RR539_00740 [Clostridium sp.]|uniref:hypothetical protein n=1 Tax=Clostridium sp. TaxID=1506 RepID=UPI002FC6FEDE